MTKLVTRCPVGIGPETAEAVLRAHPTPRSLFEAFTAAARDAAAAGGDAGKAPGRVLQGIEVRARRSGRPI